MKHKCPRTRQIPEVAFIVKTQGQDFKIYGSNINVLSQVTMVTCIWNTKALSLTIQKIWPKWKLLKSGSNFNNYRTGCWTDHSLQRFFMSIKAGSNNGNTITYTIWSHPSTELWVYLVKMFHHDLHCIWVRLEIKHVQWNYKNVVNLQIATIWKKKSLTEKKIFIGLQLFIRLSGIYMYAKNDVMFCVFVTS
jgi:hypothetical protein